MSNFPTKYTNPAYQHFSTLQAKVLDPSYCANKQDFKPISSPYIYYQRLGLSGTVLPGPNASFRDQKGLHGMTCSLGYIAYFTRTIEDV